jgi:hypothetical protein
MSLLTHPQLLWIVSVIASVFQVSLIIGAFINQGAPAETGFKGWGRKASVRVIISFCTGFGWGGVMALRKGLPPTATLVIAFTSAVTFTLLMFVMLRFLFEKTKN